MTDDNTSREVVGYCFVLRDGDSYVGCVSVQHDEFYGTARTTNYDAMLEARELGAMLCTERVITECVCACLPESLH
jgi:hypothetical protein